MSDYQELLDLLKNKRELFLECEMVTEAMMVLMADDLEAAVERRQELLDSVSVIDGRIREICIHSGKDVRAVLNHQCERNGLDSGLAAVYDASLSVKAVVNRIVQLEGTIVERMEQEKDNILQKIEKVNKSGSSVAEKYHRSVQTGVSHGGQLRSKEII